MSDCEELVGLPDRRDADPLRSIHAQIHLTTFCIDGWALLSDGPPQTPASGSGVQIVNGQDSCVQIGSGVG